MEEIQKRKEREQALVMLSGGRDSFLSVCLMIEKGYRVHMITYDNGSMAGTEHVTDLASRITDKFKEERTCYAGIELIAQDIKPFLKRMLYAETIELCRDYPQLLYYQVNCLACHTAMYLHSIAYCLANDIKVMAEGAREQQKFFVELPEMVERYKKLCEKYEIELILPVYDLDSDIVRKEKLARYGFLPKTYEPQCWVGCPMEEELSVEQKKSLLRYFDNEIMPITDRMIQELLLGKKIWAGEINRINRYE